MTDDPPWEIVAIAVVWLLVVLLTGIVLGTNLKGC